MVSECIRSDKSQGPLYFGFSGDLSGTWSGWNMEVREEKRQLSVNINTGLNMYCSYKQLHGDNPERSQPWGDNSES